MAGSAQASFDAKNLLDFDGYTEDSAGELVDAWETMERHRAAAKAFNAANKKINESMPHVSDATRVNIGGVFEVDLTPAEAGGYDVPVKNIIRKRKRAIDADAV